ncbi:MAG: hypothetical protein Q4G25_11370 [Paracoccus sp. (in: a-proteobacteria)]|nr:hypothetical protein [Paracoccus sp. (in: a-proteobacteria)]
MSETAKTAHRCRFVIVTQPRSGSYHLASMLDSAPDTTCLGEILKRDRIELPPDLAARAGIDRADVDGRDADIAAYLARLLAACETPVFGFKEFRSRIAQSGIGPLTLRSRHWQKIFLYRNPIRKYISLQRAHDTGSFTKRRDDVRPQDNVIIRFDPAGFEGVLRNDRRMRDLCQRLRAAQPGAVSEVDYRDLGDPARIGQVLRFIRSEADPAALYSSYYRQNTLSLEESVEDFDVLSRHMRENGHEALLEDALLAGT